MLIAERRRRRQKQRLLRFFACIFCLCIGVGIFSIFHSKHSIDLPKLLTAKAPIVTESLAETVPSYTLSGSMSAALGDAVQSALVGTHGTYGIVIKDLKTNESYMQNEERPFASGSLYKLWVMATVYEQMEDGKLHMSDELSKNVVDLNKEFSIDPSAAEKTDGTITYSVQDALYQMITISDNYAALLLTDKVGLNNINSFLNEYGFSHSHVGVNGNPPTTTPEDIAGFFEKLYNEQLVDKQSSDSMLDLLKQQKLNDKIPEYLPDDVVVAHKTGELDDVTHDAGIVYAPSGDYLIVVLSEIDDRDLANERIANVSKNVYDYFNNTSS